MQNPFIHECRECTVNRNPVAIALHLIFNLPLTQRPVLLNKYLQNFRPTLCIAQSMISKDMLYLTHRCKDTKFSGEE